MFYTVADGHPLPFNPFKALIAPRPIGWISSRNAAGLANLAPYSFFNGCGDDPPLVMFAQSGRKSPASLRKDSIANIAETGEFACNLASETLKHAMNASAGPHPAEVDEFEIAGLTAAPCQLIKTPRVAEAMATLECRLVRMIDDLPANDAAEPNIMVIGEVIAVHIHEAILADGKVDLTLARPIARLGYREYATVSETWEMDRPSL